MAIKDLSKKQYIEDRDDKVFIGLDLPIHKSDGIEGYFKSTSTTIQAVKNNIKNLISTEKGERLMQPNIGLKLKSFLFEQFTDETISLVKSDIVDTFRLWLPFVDVRDLSVTMNDSTGRNTMMISVVFSINRDPNTLESVQVEIGD